MAVSTRHACDGLHGHSLASRNGTWVSAHRCQPPSGFATCPHTACRPIICMIFRNVPTYRMPPQHLCYFSVSMRIAVNLITTSELHCNVPTYRMLPDYLYDFSASMCRVCAGSYAEIADSPVSVDAILSVCDGRVFSRAVLRSTASSWIPIICETQRRMRTL